MYRRSCEWPLGMTVHATDQVGEMIFGAAEVEGPAHDEHERQNRRRHEQRRARRFAAEQRPAKSLNDADQRVQCVEGSPPLGHELERIRDRRDEQPRLEQQTAGGSGRRDSGRSVPPSTGRRRGRGQQRQSANTGSQTMCIVGAMPYHAISAASSRTQTRKSTSGASTAAIGTISRGKYTLVTRLALPTTDVAGAR